MVDNKQQWKAWLYLAPAIVLLLIFTVWPIINTVQMSFLEDYDAMAAAGGAEYVYGFGNFKQVIEYKHFTNALSNTILLCVLTVPISTVLALLIAVALNSIKFLQKGLQTIFFLPYVTNSIAIGMVFATMFNIIGTFGSNDMISSSNAGIESIGVVNYLLEFLHIKPQNWVNVGSEKWANITVMVVYIVWNALPFKILVFLGGLQSINKQYYDAAKVDSTSRRRVLTRITIPLLSPMLVYVLITGFIGGFKEYSSIVGVFNEKNMGPPASGRSLNTMVGLVYQALDSGDYGRASAAALILFGIILLVTLFNGWLSKKLTHY